MNEIVIRLCDEDRARLDRVAEALENYPRKCENCVQTAIRMAQTAPAHQINEAPVENVAPTQEPENTAPTTSEADAHPVEGVQVFDAPVVEKPVATVKMSDIQQKVVALSAAGKKAEVKAVVTAYAERVTLIPEDKWNEVFKQLSALEN